LKLKSDEPPSSFAFNFTLRHYDQGGGYAVIAAGVMFGITFVIMIAAVIGGVVKIDPRLTPG